MKWLLVVVSLIGSGTPGESEMWVVAKFFDSKKQIITKSHNKTDVGNFTCVDDSLFIFDHTKYICAFCLPITFSRIVDVTKAMMLFPKAIVFCFSSTNNQQQPFPEQNTRESGESGGKNI